MNWDFCLSLVCILLFIFTVIERLAELILTQRNAAWSFARGGVEHGQSHYKWMVRMHTFFLVSIAVEWIFLEPTVSPELRWFAFVAAILCQVLRWWIIRTLGYQWNSRVIVVPHLGAVKTGPYKFFKHPNYIVVVTEILVLPLVFGAWRTSLLFSFLNLWMLSVRIRVENAALKSLNLNSSVE